ncbi:MAG TPA: DUF2905 domain-containing protein [Vicinamibacterales bacterium]|jgi:hypothetical protein|nr:DUF2905 domain-containing protein [Vicinamibacterales bacterium]
MSKLFIVLGLILVGVGVLLKLGVPLGKLPGDIVIRRGNATFYFPIVTCIIVSVVLSLLSMIWRR